MSDSKKIRDTGASVRARLLNLAQQQGQAFDLLLTREATAMDRFRSRPGWQRAQVGGHRRRPFKFPDAICATCDKAHQTAR